MTLPVFLDTAGWFAALNQKDPSHTAAAAAYHAWLAHDGRQLVTTNMVVAEMQALLARRVNVAAGLAFLDGVYADPLHEVVFADRDLERAAVDRWLRPFGDQVLSLTDAVSFEVMRERRMVEAFTFDRHFATAGYQMVPRG